VLEQQRRLRQGAAGGGGTREVDAVRHLGDKGRGGERDLGEPAASHERRDTATRRRLFDERPPLRGAPRCRPPRAPAVPDRWQTSSSPVPPDHRRAADFGTRHLFSAHGESVALRAGAPECFVDRNEPVEAMAHALCVFAV